MVMVHEIQDKRAKKALLGPSTKDGRGLKKSIGRKKAAMRKRLDEMYLWKIIGVAGKTIHDPGVRLSEAEVKEMLKTGVAPWSSSNTTGIYWGRMANRCLSDLTRCKEELPILLIEKQRCLLWVERNFSAVHMRKDEVGADSGKGILLSRWVSLLNNLSEELDALKW
jgi:hypothetical protein